MTERARGVVLDLLDFTNLELSALEKAKEAGQDVTAMNIRHQPYAVGRTPEGELWVVCHQAGVRAWRVTDEEPFELEFYGSRGTSFDMLPSMTATLSPENLKPFVSLDETIDLADLVRKFGARLESNFWSLHELFTG